MARVFVLGGGLIGAGWAAAFAAAGEAVTVIDPDPAAAARVAAVWTTARPALARIGRLADDARPAVVVATAAEAGPPPALLQEALPERLDLKRAALSAVEPALDADTIIASSSSGLSPDDLQDALRHPERLVVAHPCNPPYLMPVVELCGGGRTAPAVLDRAEAIYARLGKTVLRMARPMPGHLVNRLQAALWREAVFLVREGVASLADVERAVTIGLAPRWCLVGPSTVFHLSGAEGGMGRFLDALGPEMERWWASLGAPAFDAETRTALVDGMAAADPRPVATIAAERDRLLPELLAYLAAPPMRAAREDARANDTPTTNKHSGGTTA